MVWIKLAARVLQTSIRTRVEIRGEAGRLLISLALLPFLLGGSLQSLRAQSKKHDLHDHRSETENKSEDRSVNSFAPPDSAVLNQDGKKIRFYTDLVRNKLVVVNFIYTSCKTICPAQAANFARLQDKLGARQGRDVYLISISVDPEVDTPERLKVWGAKFGVRPGWTMVTGEKRKMEELVKALTGAPMTKDFHGTAILIGNAARQKWIREYGLANPDLLIKRIDDLAGRTK